MSLSEASEANWPEKFAKLGVAATEQHFTIESVSFDITPSLTEKVGLNDVIFFRNSLPADGVGEEPQLIPIREFMVDVQDEVIRGAQRYVKHNFLTIYKVLADLEKDLLVEWRVPVSGMHLRTSNGNEHVVNAIIFHLRVRTKYSKLNVRRHLLSDKAMVTTAVIPAGQESVAEVSLAAVQVVNRSEGKVFFEHRRKTQKKK